MTIAVDAVVYYQIANPIDSVVKVQNAQSSTKLLAQTTLRNVLGTRTLSQVLSDRESIAKEMKEILDLATDPWGESTINITCYFIFCIIQESKSPVSKLKTVSYRSRFNAQWPLKPRPHVKPRLK